MDTLQTERYETIVIGGGQAGLAVGYHLRRLGRQFLILDASERIGDAWRKRWDSLRLFSPVAFDGLPGMPFPAPAGSYPTKDEMADYLEAYARRFDLPVRSGTKVTRLAREGSSFVLTTVLGARLEAENVVVAMSSYQAPRVPSFARELGPDVVQLHSSEYCNPAQLRDGDVLVVGAGNSGAEIALEVARTHHTSLSGNGTGELPFDTTKGLARRVIAPLLFRVLFHRILTVATPIGRKARPGFLRRGTPLIRTKSRHLAAAGVERVPRTVGASGGLPLLADGRTLDVANVIWCTGFETDFSWIDLPVFGDHEPLHDRGIVPSEPGLYFVGLEFLYSASSAMIAGVGRDAERVARAVSARMAERTVGQSARSSPTASLVVR